jgi:hypothetical protein
MAGYREAMSVRLSVAQFEELALYRALTGTSANALIVRLITEFFEGPGREEIIQAMTKRATERYGTALRTLSDG